MSRIFAFKLIVFIAFMCFSCKKDAEVFYAEDVPLIEVVKDYSDLTFFEDDGKVNINTVANGNYPGVSDSRFIKNISGENYAYCHPDVQYFPEGFNGYKYWMVFTPYFGSIGTQQESKRFENPSIVVSNDGLNWTDPPGITNPIAKTPSNTESFPENRTDPIQGFWSDPDLVFSNDQFSLYYRGCMVTAQALKNRGAKSQNNATKLTSNAHRTVVRQTSTDGINWTPLEVAYNSNTPYTPQNNHLLSPTFVPTDSGIVSYEVELNTGAKNFRGKDPSYVIQRKSKDGLNFSIFKKSKIVNFINNPWVKINPKYAPWHIHATFVNGFYFLCLAVGDVKKYTADQLYLGYSTDGLNFEVLPTPLVEQNAYRSAIFPMSSDRQVIRFGAIVAYKTGMFKYREFTLNKSEIVSKSVKPVSLK